LKKVFKSIDDGLFGERGALISVIDVIRNGDYYLISQDFDDYCRAQADVIFLLPETLIFS
jgi:hypothetical protein